MTLHKSTDAGREKQSRIRELRQKKHEHAAQYVNIHGHAVQKADIYRFLGLVCFIAVTGLTIYLLWPMIGECFEPGGTTRVLNDIQSAGAGGVFILFVLQILQVVVAVIPGEITQIAAGIMYGPWLGALLIIVGAAVSSALVYLLVKKLGAPFVQAMVSDKFAARIEKLESTHRFDLIVFVLFLIPGMPKDIFTYLLPLTKMELKQFLILTTLGRFPGVLLSTYAAAGLIDGNATKSIAIFVGLGAVAVLAIVFCNPLMDRLGRAKTRHAHLEECKAAKACAKYKD